MHKTFAISRTLPDLTGFRAHWLHDSIAGIYYVVHWPRRLSEQLAFEAISSLQHFPHMADQATTMPATILAALPASVGVTHNHNTYQALKLLHAHYKWDNFHPHG